MANGLYLIEPGLEALRQVMQIYMPATCATINAACERAWGYEIPLPTIENEAYYTTNVLLVPSAIAFSIVNAGTKFLPSQNAAPVWQKADHTVEFNAICRSDSEFIAEKQAQRYIAAAWYILMTKQPQIKAILPNNFSGIDSLSSGASRTYRNKNTGAVLQILSLLAILHNTEQP